ncbi:MAG TPA: ABC transporter permease [Bacteroidales bacterium]|nr:ABC transporter permease [Bacteroidales bacterium]HRX97659.1 ABC transporter permease [Bacteroidales bacterium]
MKTNLKIAWRNLWRNKRRTLITTASIVFSVLFASFMRAIQEGSYDSMIDNMVKFYSGYLQVQDTAYWDEKTLENTIAYDSTLENEIEKIKDVRMVTPRLESFALSAYNENSKPVFVMGIVPEKEDRIIKLSEKVEKGSFITNDDKGALISQGLAKFLKLDVNDTLVMISQGYHGVSAAGKFAVKGIFKHPNPEFNNNMVYLSLNTAQDFYSAYGRYTSEIIMVHDHYEVDHVKRAILKFLPSDKRVMTWDEMNPEMLKMIQGDRAGGIIMLWILYLVIGFGIFGTVMMMVNERRREFGVINAVGMRKSRINMMLFAEIVMMGMLGAIIGLLLTAPIIWWFYENPLPMPPDMAGAMEAYGVEPYMFVSIRLMIYFNQALTIFLLSSFIAAIMMISVKRLNMVKALRG